VNMIVELSSGKMDTKQVDDDGIVELLSVLSFVDNCLEYGDDTLFDRHYQIKEIMRNIGLTPAGDRDED